MTLVASRSAETGHADVAWAIMNALEAALIVDTTDINQQGASTRSHPSILMSYATATTLAAQPAVSSIATETPGSPRHRCLVLAILSQYWKAALPLNMDSVPSTPIGTTCRMTFRQYLDCFGRPVITPVH